MRPSMPFDEVEFYEKHIDMISRRFDVGKKMSL